MARQVVAAVVMAVLAAPLFSGFGVDGARMCTNHACPHHGSPATPCHQATRATCELKCGCQGRQAAGLLATPLYLTTPTAELAVPGVSTAAAASAPAALPAGHRRLEPRPPRQRTSAL